MQNSFNPDLGDFIEILNQNQGDYLLLGGYAVILHGYTRSTGVMDLWVKHSKENYLKLAKAYKDFGTPIFSEKEFLASDFDVWSIGREPSKIEILTHVDGLNFEESFKNCCWFDLGKIKLPYIF